jgi:cyclic 2,3-diphosphoglycerate synthetase
MGRGGPEKPEIVRGDLIKLTPEYLMEQSDKGVHAASDHWEDALMSRILTIGCRR